MTLQERVLAASRQAHSENPERLNTNRNVDCFKHSTRVIQLLRDQGLDAAYVGKTRGEGQYPPPVGFPRQVGQWTITGVSHDAIWVGGAQFDLIAAGNDGAEPLGAPGVPVANLIPSEFYRPNNPPVAYPITAVEPPPPQHEPYPGDAVFDAVGEALFGDYQLAGQAPNAQMGRWFGRVIFDWLAKNEPTLDASIAKHRKEWRALLGLPS